MSQKPQAPRSRFSSRWVKHLTSEAEREQLIKTVLASQTALQRLKELLLEDLQALEAQESSLDDFESAAWSHKQAFRNGSKAALKKALDLLVFSK